MIVSLATRVSSQVVELEQRKQTTNVNQAMRDTKNALIHLGNKLETLTAFVVPNNGRIQGESRKQLVVGLENLRKAIKDLKILFKEERRQVQQLQLIGNAVDVELRNAKSVWSTNFRAEMEPIFQAAILTAKLLPAESRGKIDELQREIEGYFTAPPLDIKQSIRLVEKVAYLRQFTVSGIINNPAVASFLTKVQNGTATLADLNSDVIAWIKEEKNHRRFKITFSK